MSNINGVEKYSYFFNGRPPNEIIYEDEQCVVFEEVNSQAPVHFLVVPKKIIPRLSHALPDDEKLLGRLLNVARKVAKLKGLNDSGFRVVVNDGSHGGQTVDQICVQVLGGRQMFWPFG